jgi:hypothetical protein
MTSSKQAQERKAAKRLGRAGQKVDVLVARARDATGMSLVGSPGTSM